MKLAENFLLLMYRAAFLSIHMSADRIHKFLDEMHADVMNDTTV